MRKLLLLLGFVWSALLASGQQLTYEFTYDNAGNCIRRAVIYVVEAKGGENDLVKSDRPLTDIMSNGETIVIYPNPTYGDIRFELSGNQTIEKYSIFDASGKLINNGNCDNSTLTMDLSKHAKGIYLIELMIENKTFLYKVIKQ